MATVIEYPPIWPVRARPFQKCPRCRKRAGICPGSRRFFVSVVYGDGHGYTVLVCERCRFERA